MITVLIKLQPGIQIASFMTFLEDHGIDSLIQVCKGKFYSLYMYMSEEDVNLFKLCSKGQFTWGDIDESTMYICHSECTGAGHHG